MNERPCPSLATHPWKMGKTTTPTTIWGFRGKYAFLSNFYPAQVWYGGKSFRSLEHAYQAARTLDARERAWIRESASPGEARRRGARVTLRDDWDTICVEVMRQLVRQKFTHHASLRTQLLATDHAVLVEERSDQDTFWGVAHGEGLNILGQLLMEVRMEAQQALQWKQLRENAHVPEPPPGSAQEALLMLCADLLAAGIYLTLQEGKLIAGPTLQVKKHPKLLEGLRTHKQTLKELLEDSLAYQLFGTNQDDKRFETDTCPECQQAVYIVTPPRRLGAHRLQDKQTVCPGSERAQQACALQLLDAFLEDRAIPRAGAVLTWTSFEGSFRVWCLSLGWLRPPRPYLMQALDKRFERFGTDPQRPMWKGLTLKQEEWYGEDEVRPVVQEAAQERVPAQVSVQDGKVRLRA